jgi:2-dehydropantoate 2-reductase
MTTAPVSPFGNVAVVGAGGVGAYVGGWLSRTLSVTLVDGWREHVEVIQADGLTIDDARGRTVFRPRAVHISEIASAESAPFDIALICVKSYDTVDAVELIAPYLRDTGLFVTLQNGMNEDTIAEVVGAGRVLGAVVTGISVSLDAPGHVLRSVARKDADKPVFLVGGITSAGTQQAAAVADLFGGVDAAAVTLDLRLERWQKLSANCVINGPCALLGATTPQLMRETAVHPFLAALALETVEVGTGLGYGVNAVFGFSAPRLRAVIEGEQSERTDFANKMAHLSAQLTDSSVPSTAQDIRRGRRTEIDSLNGYVVAKANLTGCSLPANQFVVDGIRMIEDGSLAPGARSLWQAMANWPKPGYAGEAQRG